MNKKNLMNSFIIKEDRESDLIPIYKNQFTKLINKLIFAP